MKNGIMGQNDIRKNLVLGGFFVAVFLLLLFFLVGFCVVVWLPYKASIELSFPSFFIPPNIYNTLPSITAECCKKTRLVARNPPCGEMGCCDLPLPTRALRAVEVTP